MNSATRPRKKFGLGLTGGLLAAVVVAALGGPLAASAAPTITPGSTGSLTVHKFENPSQASGLPNNGTEVDTSGLTPLPGVTFKVQQVEGIDLSTNQGWTDANDLSGHFVPSDPAGSITGAGYTLASGTSQTTVGDGSAAFSGLPIGLYLVTETGVPTMGPDGKPVTVTPANPFLVTIPISTSGSGGDGWLYDVNVYPKNAVTTATKSADDGHVVQIGDPMTWTITGGIGGVPIDVNGDGVISGVEETYNIAGYTIIDPLDSRLVYQTSPAPVLSIVDNNTPANTIATLTPGTDYTLTAPSAGNDNTLRVDLTPAGLAKLMANHGMNVQLTFTTIANASGSISNTATVYPNGYTTNETPGTPGAPLTPSVDVKFGGVEVLKTNESGAALSGAVFEVYTQLDSNGNPVASSKVTVDDGTSQVSQWTSGANGTLTISGLRWSNYAHGETITSSDPAWLNYYLVEVTAPSGYSLLANPVHFTVTGDASTSVSSPDLTVKDVPVNAGFSLPLTGSTGAGVLIGAGVLLFGGGAALWLLVLARRKSRQAREAAATLL